MPLFFLAFLLIFRPARACAAEISGFGKKRFGFHCGHRVHKTEIQATSN
jgi:hypothetical protein